MSLINDQWEDFVENGSKSVRVQHSMLSKFRKKLMKKGVKFFQGTPLMEVFNKKKANRVSKKIVACLQEFDDMLEPATGKGYSFDDLEFQYKFIYKLITDNKSILEKYEKDSLDNSKLWLSENYDKMKNKEISPQVAGAAEQDSDSVQQATDVSASITPVLPVEASKPDHIVTAPTSFRKALAIQKSSNKEENSNHKSEINDFSNLIQFGSYREYIEGYCKYKGISPIDLYVKMTNGEVFDDLIKSEKDFNIEFSKQKELVEINNELIKLKQDRKELLEKLELMNQEREKMEETVKNVQQSIDQIDSQSEQLNSAIRIR
jgi:hypothetical protein